MFLEAIEPYPAKSVLEDVFLRYGPPDEYSFTPYNGMRHIVDKVTNKSMTSGFGSVRYDIDYRDFSSRLNDFSAISAKVSEKLAIEEYRKTEDDSLFQGVRELNTSVIRRLEDVPEAFIEKYVRDVVTASVSNAEGYIRVAEGELELTRSFEDEEGEFTGEADLQVEEEYSSYTEDYVEARARIPFLLKELWKGSKVKRGHLLSFIIAEQTILSNNAASSLSPAQIVAQDVFTCDKQGNIGRRFEPSDNTQETLRHLIAWTKGLVEKDIYYEYSRELLSICSLLDVDITKEDPKMYTPEFIEKIMCTYLISLDEYEDRFIRGFTKEQLFRRQDIESVKKKELALSDIVANFASDIDRDLIEQRKERMQGDRLVQNFLTKLKELKYLTKTVKVVDFSIKCGFCYDESRQEFLTILVNKLVGVGSAIDEYCIIDATGLIVRVLPNSKFIIFADLDDFTSAMPTTHGVEDLWKTTVRS